MTVLTNKLVDVSNWDYATFDAVCLKAQGVGSIILGCQNETIADTMALQAQAAGIRIIGVYAYLKDALTLITVGVRTAIGIAQSYGVRRVWLDCETAALTVPEIRAARAQVRAAGLLTGIYTGKYVWESYGNPTEFSDDPLWHAEYGTNESDHPRQPVTEVAYGGWKRPDIHQYNSTITVCGRVRDHNYLFDWAQDAQGEDMTEVEDILLAAFSGSEEASLSRDVRLANARYRMAQVVTPPDHPDAPTQSLTERIRTSATVQPHIHSMDGITTGGIKR